MNFEKFFRTSLLESTSEKLLISCTSSSIPTSRTVKNYFTGAYSSIVYMNTRSSHSKAFIYLNLWKLSVKRLICDEVARFNLQVYEKSFTYLPSFILPSFSKNASWLLLPKRLWNCASKISFRKYKQKVVLLVIYLFNYSSSKSTSFMLNAAFDFVLVRFSSSKLEFIAIKRLQKHSYFLAVCVLISSTI